MSINMFVNPHLFKQKIFESHGFMARSLMDRIQKNPSKSFFYRLNPLKFHDIIIFDGFFMTSHGFSIKKPSKKPWKIHHWASTCHQGPRRPPSGGSSPSRSEGSGERSPRTPGPPWGRCNYGWYMMGIYIMYVYIYIYIHS